MARASAREGFCAFVTVLNTGGDQAHEARQRAVDAVSNGIHNTVSCRIASTHPNTTELVVGDENFRLTGLQVITATASVGSGARVVRSIPASSNSDFVPDRQL